MVSVKFSVFFWAVLVLFAQFHSGYSLFLGYKKELLKHKLYKLKEALLDDGHEEVHVHTYYPSLSYGKFGSYGSYGSFGSHGYGFPSYSYGHGGWH